MAYTKNEWSIGSPITKAKMDRIEQGIADAHADLNNKIGQSGLDNAVTTINETITGINDRVIVIEGQMETVSQTNQEFANIVGEVQSAHRSSVTDDNLAQRFADDEKGITDARTDLNSLTSVVSAAYNETNVITLANGTQRKAESLKEKISDMDSKIDKALREANTALSTLDPEGENQRSVTQRLSALDADSVPTMTVPAIIAEIQNARGLDANNTANANLSARFSADETRIQALETTMPTKVNTNDIVNNLNSESVGVPLSANQGRVLAGMIANAQSAAETTAQTYADNNKVDKTDIANNLTTEANVTGHVLDARQGTALNSRLTDVENEISGAHITGDAATLDARFDNIDGGTRPTRTLPNLIIEVENARTSSVVRTPGANDGDPDTDTTYGSLDARLEAIETAATANNTTANGRLTALENNVNGAKVENGPQTLDARFDAVEDRATQLETDVHTIAGELHMVNTQTNAIQDTNSRIDTIEENVVAIGKEIGMLQDESSVVDLSNAVSRTNTRVDTIDGRTTNIETELSDARIQIGTDENEQPIMSTLDQRLDSIDTSVSTISNTLGTGFNTSTNTVAAAIASAQSTAISTANGYTDTATAEIGAAHRTGLTDDQDQPITDTLDNRFDDIEERLDALDTPTTGAIADLDGRVSSLNTTINAETTGLVDRMESAEYEISHTATQDDTTTGLKERMTAAETSLAGKALQSDLNTLSTTVGNISTTIVLAKNQVNFTNEYVPTTLIGSSIVDKNDYLIQSPEDDKYYYWKHINNEWHLMGGAGNGEGSGTSSAEILSTLPTAENANVNTDYYIGTQANGYLHYRFIDVEGTLTPVLIGVNPDNIKKYNVAVGTETVSDVETNYLYLYQFGYGESNAVASSDIEDLNDSTKDTYRLLTKVPLPAGGGGGGISSTALKVTRITPRVITAALNSADAVKLQYYFSSGEEIEDAHYSLKVDGVTVIPSGDTTAIRGGLYANKSNTWPTSNGVPVDPTQAPVGFYELDITQYCNTIGTHNIELIITLDDNTSLVATGTWELKVIQFYLESTSENGLIISTSEETSITYTPFGAISKTLHIVIDNDTAHENTVALSATNSGRELSYIIPAQTHGAHKIDMYMTANINGEDVPSNHIYREYIWYNPNNTSTPIIIASPYSGQTLTVDSYTELEIPYSVYNKAGGTYGVEYYLNYGLTGQQLISNITLTGNASDTLYYAPVTMQEHENQTLTIKVDSVTMTINLVVKAIDADVSVVQGAIIDFDPSTLTNNSVNRLPSWTVGGNTYSLTASDNFNWSNDISGGGYKEDKDGKCFVIKAGSYIDLNYKMFKSLAGASEVFDTGAEMKIVFKTAAVRNAEAIWFTNVGTLANKPVGIQLGAHYGWLKTDKASDTSVSADIEYQSWSSNGINPTTEAPYAVDAIVVYKNVIYKCTKVSTNYTILAPTASGMNKYWTPLVGSSWASGTEYKKDAIVSKSGITYQCIKDVIEEKLSSAPDAEGMDEYWKVIITPWVSGTEYAKGIIVQNNGTSYVCIKNIITDVAETAPNATGMDEYWAEIGAWTSGNTYATDALVIYSNIIYKCIKDVINEITTNPKDLSGNWLKMGAVETETISTNSYLYFPYSENDKIELDININKYNSAKKNNFIMSYEDGVPSKAYAYTYGSSGDGLRHTENNESTIRIGSEDCDVYIYKLRIYNKSLNTGDILQNFIADGKTVKEKIDRYNRNCIYWDAEQGRYYTTPSGTAVLDPIKLAECMPDVKVLMLDTPIFTTGKKDFVKNSTLRCLQAEGGKVFPADINLDNWFFQKGLHAGQGTTSDNYGQAGRNVDFLFECDDIHWPTKKKDIQKTYSLQSGYRSSVLMGNDASEWVEVDQQNHIYAWQAVDGAEADPCLDWKGDNCKVALTRTSVPNNFFNLKVNIASSENVNNALFQKRYNEFLTYTSPANAAQHAKHSEYDEDITVKNTMEFVPAVLFIRENDPDLSKHTEFNDTKWHFYALGNIGDSKKTDYTRAYDPDDINEFTCENSDNNTNNGQFQSGVFDYNGHEAIETNHKAWSATTAYKIDDIVVYEGSLYKRIGANQAELESGQSYTWVAADWSAITYTNWTDDNPPYFVPRTDPNSMKYLFPITSSQWNVKVGNEYLNRKHQTLVEEEFDGDHSFEFRYACLGDYRDGALVNDTTGHAEEQYELNHDVMLAFYEWLVTADSDQYVAEANQWFVPSAMEFFYAFTHYYTMMDNRAKNTFWHFAKTGKYRKVSRPVPELFHIYKVSNDAVRDTSEGANANLWTGTFGAPEGEFDPTATYYTQYAFDLWVYDCDTAAGIDNNGALVFPYGKEDDDYRTEGDAASGYAFNGAGSIFWRRLKTSFANQIAETMTAANVACFNSQNLIDEFDKFQNCYPEEIWRLDIERKYIRTFTGESIDNSITTGKQNPRFLTSMMQGRKKYQRRQWIRDQGVYFNSKYRLPDITNNSNTTEFNLTTPSEISDIAVTPSYLLKLKPYQDMYLNVQIGNGNYIEPSIRAKAGVEYTIDLAEKSSGNFQETRIYINGANHLSEIGNLAPMYPYAFDLRALAHIRSLDIGTDETGYANTKFTELVLSSNIPLLEELNIKNCHSVAGTINLSTANNLRVIEAEGTNITGVNLPDYTSIETLHLPSTVSSLSLYGARKLKDFYMKNSAGTEDYSSLFTLDIYDSDYSANFKEDPNDPLPVDWIDIALQAIEKVNVDKIFLEQLSSATIGDIQELEPLSSTKALIESSYEKIKLTGTIHVTGTWSEVEKDSYAGKSTSVWPQLNLDTTNGTLQVKHRVDYVEENARDGQNQLIKSKIIKTLYINDGDTAPDIYATGVLTEKPTKAPTAASVYEFGSINELTNRYVAYSGWSLENSGVALNRAPIITEDTVIVTYFNEYDHMYYIRWYLHESDSTPVYETQSRVPYGGGYDIDAPTVQYIQSQGKSTCSVNVTGGQITYSIFKGWDKLPTNITPDANDEAYNIYGVWEEPEGGSTTIPQMFASNNISNLSPQQLLALSAMNNNIKQTYADYITNQIAVNTRITYPLGYEGPSDATATEIIPLNNILRLDAGDDPITTNLQPLVVNNDGFTFAIDYCLDPNAEYDNTTSYGILASCYYNSNGVKSGFAIYYDKEYDEVRIGFGDIFNVNNTYSKCIGTSSTVGQRNILVIRHTKGSSDLHIYSGLDSGMTIPETVYSDVINYPNNFNCNSKIYIGTLVNTDPSDGITSMIDSCKSTVYWAKFWSEDLGSGECKRIASWPRETITYAIASLSNNASSRSTTPPSPSIQLVSLNTSAHGRVVQPKINSSDYSWNNSPIQKICNQRIFNSLPILLQSILYKTQVFSRPINYIIDNNLGNSQKLGTASATYDYVYAYSAANVPSNTSDYNAEGQLFAWNNNTENMACYLYNNGNWNTDTASTYYMSIRFPNKAIMWGTSSANKLRIFVAQPGNVPNSNIAYSIDQKMGGIKSGDIYVEGENAYMYVYTSEIASLGLQVKSATEDSRFAISNSIEAARRGSWITAEDYWTRSLIPNASGNGTNFAFVKKIGALDSSTLGNTQSRKKLSYIISL